MKFEDVFESVALSNSFPSVSLWQLRCVCINENPDAGTRLRMCDCESHIPVTNPVSGQLLPKQCMKLNRLHCFHFVDSVMRRFSTVKYHSSSLERWKSDHPKTVQSQRTLSICLKFESPTTITEDQVQLHILLGVWLQSLQTKFNFTSYGVWLQSLQTTNFNCSQTPPPGHEAAVQLDAAIIPLAPSNL